MPIRGTTRLIALLGNPVKHSLSPAMHNAAFEKYALDFAYVPWGFEEHNLKIMIDAIKALNMVGANVTLPYKQKIIPFLDEISDLSQQIGAVNTIINKDGKLIGTTTDPIGFLQNFRSSGHSFTGKKIALLGNGGSARTLAFALCMQDKPFEVCLVARDVLKSQQLQIEINEKLGQFISFCDFSEYAKIAARFEVVVNATSIGMHPQTEQSPLAKKDIHPGQVIYDIVYAPEKTRLLQDAEACGLQIVGGLGMLVHQGIASFQYWTGIMPDPQLFLASARHQLDNKI